MPKFSERMENASGRLPKLAYKFQFEQDRRRDADDRGWVMRNVIEINLESMLDVGRESCANSDVVIGRGNLFRPG